MRFVGGRVAHALLVLIVVTLATTAMVNLTPGDPAAAILGEGATAAQLRATDHQLGVDRPFVVQYARWVRKAVTGDLGTSHLTHLKVESAIRQTLPVTLEISLLGLGIALLLAVPWGIVSAYKADSAIDQVSNMGGSLLISSPSFLTGLALAFALAVKSHVFPVTGWVNLTADPIENLRYAFLPSFTLGLGLAAIFARVLRSDLVTTLREEYILAAYSKGLKVRRVLFAHALRPSLFSLVTLIGLSLGQLLGGAVIVESLFSLPGVGSLLISSIQGKDIVTVQGVVVVITVGYIVVNSIADIVYVFLDPRVRARTRV